MLVKTGTYTGDGLDGHAITDVGFQADLIIVKSLTTAQDTMFRTSSHPTNESSYIRKDLANPTTGIKSMTSNGFTLGTLADANKSGDSFVYVAIKKTSANDFNVGTYTGNGADGLAITGIGFKPTFVLSKSNSGITGAMRFSLNSNSSVAFVGGDRSDLFASFDANGFTVNDGSASGGNLINVNATAHYWFAFKEVAKNCTVFTYTGSGADNRDITVGFAPLFVLVKQTGSTIGVWRSSAHSGDSSSPWDNSGATDKIQAFNSTGFQVGTNVDVNQNLATYYGLAFKSLTRYRTRSPMTGAGD